MKKNNEKFKDVEIGKAVNENSTMELFYDSIYRESVFCKCPTCDSKKQISISSIRKGKPQKCSRCDLDWYIKQKMGIKSTKRVYKAWNFNSIYSFEKFKEFYFNILMTGKIYLYKIDTSLPKNPSNAKFLSLDDVCDLRSMERNGVGTRIGYDKIYILSNNNTGLSFQSRIKSGEQLLYLPTRRTLKEAVEQYNAAARIIGIEEQVYDKDNKNWRYTQFKPLDKPCYYVYKITNKLTGDFYIGSHSSGIFDNESNSPLDPFYWSTNKALQAQFNKFSKKSFKREILEICDTRDYAYDREAEFIAEVHSSPKCLNVKNGR